MKRLFSALLAAALLIGGTTAFACEMAGKNKHIGNIVAVDKDGKTFVIMDAETRSEIRFLASAQTLSSLSVNDQVQVSYEKTADGDLVTMDVIQI